MYAIANSHFLFPGGSPESGIADFEIPMQEPDYLWKYQKHVPCVCMYVVVTFSVFTIASIALRLPFNFVN